jgi:hypothetical protein
MITIEHRGGFGRVAVTTESIEDVGTIVIREKQLLLWENHKWDEFFEKFLELPDATKRLILDMTVPPRNSKPMEGAEQSAAYLLQDNPRFRQLGVEYVTKLIAIAKTNVHSYSDKQLGKLEDMLDGLSDAHSDESKCALLALGSHVAHSCLPNVFSHCQNRMVSLSINSFVQLPPGT